MHRLFGLALAAAVALSAASWVTDLLGQTEAALRMLP